MFARLPDDTGDAVVVCIDGVAFTTHATDTVAAAMLLSGRLGNRVTPVTGAPRGPWCLMGACFDCLVTIDGQPNQQGCIRRVAAGMRIETQAGARALARTPCATGEP
jgi:predicted molibdopterin-dependent oxidoreductase YjgC